MQIEVARRLVEAWHKDSNAWWAVKKGLLDDGVIATVEETKQAVGVFWQPWWNYNARKFFGNFFKTVGDALFDGISDERAVAMLIKTKPDAHMRAIRPRNPKDELKISFRARDKRHDWGTVK